MNIFVHLMAGLINPPAVFARPLANWVYPGVANTGRAAGFASPKADLVITQTAFAVAKATKAETKVSQLKAKAA